MKVKALNLILIVIAMMSVCSCQKYLDVGPSPVQPSRASIFNNDATAVAAMYSVYAKMEAERLPYLLVVNTGLSADEMTNYSSNSTSLEFFTNNLTSSNSEVQQMWTNLYRYIYEANAVLEGIQNSTSVTQSVKQQLEGEARFTRAFCYFYLVNLYGKVPLLLTTDYRENATKAQSNLNDINAQIINDFQEAKAMLSTTYIGTKGEATTERVRPTRWAAIALLARVNLYAGNWQQALEMSSEVINQSSQFALVPDPSQTFLKNSKEAIWQLMATFPRYNTYIGGTLVQNGAPSIAALSATLVNSFAPNDKRYTTWIKPVTVGAVNYHYPFKYKVGQNATSITEYTMILRLAEQYLIRAEAKARMNDLSGALADLNAIRSRAGLLPVAANSQAEFLTLLRAERNNELFAEFGDRWLNLKRLSLATITLQSVKGANWTPSVDELYPIPLQEILRNSNLSQNPGY